MNIIKNYNWDLEKIYDSKEKLEEDIQIIKEKIKKLEDLSKNLGDNFGEFIRLYEETMRELVTPIVYAHMKHDEDTRDPYGQKISIETMSLFSELQTVSAGLNPFILSLDKTELDKLIIDEDLEKYRKYLEKIFRFKEHTLTAKEERILGALSPVTNAPSEAYTLLTNADIEYPEIESVGNVKLTDANYGKLLQNPNVEVRKETFKKYYETLGKVDNTIASLQYNNVRSLVIESKLRNYKSAREMELFKDDVEVEVYDNLINVVHSYLPILHKYFRLKKEYLGLEEQHMYDIYLPLLKEEAKKITFEESKEIILEAVKPMGEEYRSIIKKAFDENWIDVYPREGKKSGAYSSGAYDTDPYILMNFTDDFDSLFTLAHELGHSIHSYYSRKNNEFIYSQYTIFVAEVASTANELLLLDYLMKNAENDDERFFLISHYIDSFKSTVFRQTQFAEFEKLTHDAVEGDKVLTLDDFNEIYYDLNKKYYGDAIVHDEEIKLEWARIPHFYRNFYVYKYATGFSTAVTLSQRILSGNKEYLEAYINFLKDGGNNYPLDQLRAAGADISKPEVLNAAFKVFENLVNELEELMK